MFQPPIAYPRVHANASICPPGCHDGFPASPLPSVSRSISAPSIFIRYTCCGPERPDVNAISLPVLGLTFGSVSIATSEEIRRKPVPSKFAMKIRQQPPDDEEYTIC